MRYRAGLLVLCSIIVASTGSTISSAVVASDWKAGNIIDDFSFTDSNAMSVSDVQNFLNSKISCDTNGTKTSELGGGTRAQYGASKGNPAPFTCLNGYYEVPKTSPGADAPVSNYGQSAIPVGAQSAAQLIVNSAKKYSISPKVLLVKLATESPGPLTSDEWPLKNQYSYAMGAHCPDSGPGGSANCDTNYAGFSIQMDEAAKLLRGYLDNMSQSWWPYKKPYQVNSVLWHVVERGCGSSNVYLESKATAALYTYTPYQPNQAALNNMYGSGDYCSTYGNRNFWRVYRDWFGSGESYSWQLVDQGAYADQARTQRLGYSPSAQPGKALYMQIKARNTGYLSWDSMTRLATDNPPGSNSLLYAPSAWLSPNRPTALKETSVKPGEVGTFDFSISAPSALRSYNQQFILVQDGAKLFPDIGQNFTIDVTPLASADRAVTRSFTVGSYLKSGESILSSDGNSILVMQPDGNLVLMNNFKPVWQTNTSGNPGSYLVLQGDGNLVLYNKNSTPTWSSASQGSGSNSLNLQTDANLVLYKPGAAVWWSGTNTVQSQNEIVNPRMQSTDILYPYQRIETADRSRTLLLQPDGNLVLYDKSMKPLWNTETNGKNIAFLALQPDGNLVLYDKSMKPLWNSGTSGRGSSRLILQDDSNLVLYQDSGQATWATYTNK